MGVNIKDIVQAEIIKFEKLQDKVIAIDAYNTIYQFLYIIRQFDGKPLVDRNGFVTSHLSGIFYRTINLMEQKIKPVYIFDGKPPLLKYKTLTERNLIRTESEIKWKDALEKGEYEEAQKYAKASSRLSKEMVDEAKKLILFMGIPVIDAPSEGEAQASYMSSKGDVWACGSQDWDSLLFGTQRLVRNLTITGKRKIPNKQAYIQVEPEIVYLETVLKSNDITREQLIDISILIGTDYNKGVKGIGPKTALKLIKEYGNLEKIIEVKKINFDFNQLNEIRNLFLKPKIKNDYELKWFESDNAKIIELLHSKHDFSIDRITKALQRLKELNEKKAKTTLDVWFKV